MPSDLRLFLGQLFRKPHQVVALAPSSEDLAREMAVPAKGVTGPVIELGAGTGKITRALLDAGIHAGDLHSLEMNPDFVDYLSANFPGVHVLNRNAQDIADLGAENVGAVVSGLPLLSMPLEVQRNIVGGAFKVLKPGGAYIQFTYGPKPPVTKAVRDELGLVWTKSHKIWGNLPPARVYTFRQKALQ